MGPKGASVPKAKGKLPERVVKQMEEKEKDVFAGKVSEKEENDIMRELFTQPEDVVGSWQRSQFLTRHFIPACAFLALIDLSPFYTRRNSISWRPRRRRPRRRPRSWPT